MSSDSEKWAKWSRHRLLLSRTMQFWYARVSGVANTCSADSCLSADRDLRGRAFNGGNSLRGSIKTHSNFYRSFIFANYSAMRHDETIFVVAVVTSDKDTRPSRID